jgi:Tfp pilus assembly protein PilO
VKKRMSESFMTQTIAAARRIVDRPWSRRGSKNVSIPAFKLSPRAMKGAWIVLAAVVLLLLFAILPYAWHLSLRQQAAAQSAELDLLKARVLARESARGPVLTEQDQLQDMFLPGTTAGTTLASFQTIVSEAAAASGISVLRMQQLPTDEVEGLSPYRLSVDATGSLEQLQQFLLDVEAMLPVVIVSGFDIVPRSAGGAEPQPYPSEDLAITLRLEAYAWRGVP